MGQILCLAYIISFNSRTAIKINVMFPFYIWGNWGSEKVNTIWTWHYTCNPLQDMASARARGKTFLSLLPRAPHVILTWQTPLTRSALSFPHPEGSEPSFMDVKMCLLIDVCWDSEPLHPSALLLSVHPPTASAKIVRVTEPYMRGESSVLYTEEVLSRVWGWKVAVVVKVEAAPVWGCWLGCWGHSQSQGQNLSTGFPCQVRTRPACGSLNWALVYYCNEDPFSNVFFLALMWLNCYFSHLTFFAYEMFWINMQLKWLVTDCVHF